MEPLPQLDNIPIFESPKKTPFKQPVLSGKENVLRETNMNIQNSKSPPLKPAKKFRTEDNEILRVKRKISNATKMGLPVQTRNPATMAKRNARERRRVQNINCTLDNLERILPEHYLDKKDKNKKLSKLEILRCTIDYIKSLQHILTEDNQNNNLLLDAAGLLPSFMFQNASQMMDISSLNHLAQSQQGDMMDLSQMGFAPTSCSTSENQWIMAPQQTIASTLPQQTNLVQQTAVPPLYQQQQYEQAFWNVL